MINADVSNLRRVTDDTAADFHPVWSPDGTQIAFLTDRAGGRVHIFVHDLETGEETEFLFELPQLKVERQREKNCRNENYAT